MKKVIVLAIVSFLACSGIYAQEDVVINKKDDGSITIEKKDDFLITIMGESEDEWVVQHMMIKKYYEEILEPQKLISEKESSLKGMTVYEEVSTAGGHTFFYYHLRNENICIPTLTIFKNNTSMTPEDRKIVIEYIYLNTYKSGDNNR